MGRDEQWERSERAVWRATFVVMALGVVFYGAVIAGIVLAILKWVV